MRLPNGFGSVYKLSGNRRRPWIARKTIRLDDDGRQIYQTIGYFKDRPEALMALAEYNKNPYSIEAATITFAEIYEQWKAEEFPGDLNRTTKARLNSYEAAFKKAAPLHDMIFVQIRKAHMQPIVDNCDKGYETKKKIKVLFNQMYRYALENDITKSDYAQYVRLPGDDEAGSGRQPFSAAEIDLLWDNLDRMDYIDAVLIMIYTGLRPGELVDIETAKVYLDKRYMRGGKKTRAGKNRVIPINKKILPLIDARLGGDHLIINPNTGRKETYWNFYHKKWKAIMEQLQMDHRPHDCRHTFASLMDSAGANKLCIKRIMGHKSQDLTDDTYTHKEIQELIDAVDLI